MKTNLKTNLKATLLYLFASLLVLSMAGPGQAQYLKDWKNTVFLEVEGFNDLGGWFLDTQFMDQLGSPVLLAHGFGEPVADARTKVIFPKKGSYRIWVRTRNWVAPWTTEYAPGKFQVGINGKLNPTIFGTMGNPWSWQEGEKVIIEKDNQEVTVSLHDLTGFDGRVDAICFSADTDFTPPNNVRLAELRRQAQNIPDVIPKASEKPFDFVVVGGGIAGVCTAITAARLGLEVALIQDRPVLGGNSSTEIRVHLGGKINQEPYPNLGNLTWLMGPESGGNGREAAHYKDGQRLELVLAEKTLHLFLNTHVNQSACKRTGPFYQLVSVTGVNIATGLPLLFEGKLFADCTGDGNLGILAGADWRMGRESRAETGETMAPEKGDKMTMGASIQWNTINTGKETTFPDLPWAIQFSPETIKPMIHGDWDWETGMNRDQINDIEWIRDNGLRAAYGHWSYMKNKMDGPWKEKVKNLKFGWVSAIAGKRESRRLLGDVILQQQHLLEPIILEDASATTTWGIDLHYPEPNNLKHFPGQEFRSIAPTTRINPYPIPYRCFYSRNINNMFMAGRHISVTHVALGTTRVMRTQGMMGEVVGMAAYLCKKHDCLPREVYASYFPELQDLMKKGIAPLPPYMVLFNQPEWTKNPGKNLARSANVEVSSVLEKYEARYINDGLCNINSNVERWVSQRQVDNDFIPPWVLFTFDHPVEINAFRIFSGVQGGLDPIRNFVLQYEKNGIFIDIPETKVESNQSKAISMKFPPIKAKQFRLYITETPGNIARLWEVEFYRLP